MKHTFPVPFVWIIMDQRVCTERVALIQLVRRTLRAGERARASKLLRRRKAPRRNRANDVVGSVSHLGPLEIAPRKGGSIVPISQ